MRKDVIFVQHILRRFNCHQLAGLDVDGELYLCLAAQQHHLGLYHSIILIIKGLYKAVFSYMATT